MDDVNLLLTAFGSRMANASSLCNQFSLCMLHKKLQFNMVFIELFIDCFECAGEIDRDRKY